MMFFVILWTRLYPLETHLLFFVFADIVIIPERNLVYRSNATTIMYKFPLFGHATDQQNLAKTLRLVRITWKVLWFFFNWLGFSVLTIKFSLYDWQVLMMSMFKCGHYMNSAATSIASCPGWTLWNLAMSALSSTLGIDDPLTTTQTAINSSESNWPELPEQWCIWLRYRESIVVFRFYRCSHWY